MNPSTDLLLKDEVYRIVGAAIEAKDSVDQEKHLRPFALIRG